MVIHEKLLLVIECAQRMEGACTVLESALQLSAILTGTLDAAKLERFAGLTDTQHACTHTRAHTQGVGTQQSVSQLLGDALLLSCVRVFVRVCPTMSSIPTAGFLISTLSNDVSLHQTTQVMCAKCLRFLDALNDARSLRGSYLTTQNPDNRKKHQEGTKGANEKAGIMASADFCLVWFFLLVCVIVAHLSSPCSCR